ncbi:MAG: hypothetical protein E7262_08955 [Lachnospiraceae bacterium]|nr:hypothetical protein [Lachnospiraceae bacterium]
MIRTGDYTQVTNYYKNNSVNKKNNTNKAKETEDIQDILGCGNKIKGSEDKLSQKAKDYLEQLRKNNKDFDFLVADKGDDFKGLVGQSKKEFSVVFTSAELEKMASDEKYAQEKLATIDTVVKMSKKINEQFGFESGWDKENGIGTKLNKLTMAFDDNGNMKLFAELEQVTQKQQERIENLKEKKAQDNSNDKVGDMKEKKNDKKDVTVKKTVVEATSEEELISKIGEWDWSQVTEEKAMEGMMLDISI